MYSLAQVAHPDFGRSWHEAVALVQEVASQLDPGVTVPSAEDLLVDEEGALIFGFANETSEAPVTSLGRLLKSLLAGTAAPSGLLELAEENASDAPAHTTVPGFCRALSFYERPNRSNDILAVAGRLGAARVHRDADWEVGRLREKMGQESAEPDLAAVSEEDANIQELRKAFTTRPEPWKFRWRYPRRYERAAIAGAAVAGLLLFLAGFAASGSSPRLADRRTAPPAATAPEPAAAIAQEPVADPVPVETSATEPVESSATALMGVAGNTGVSARPDRPLRASEPRNAAPSFVRTPTRQDRASSQRTRDPRPNLPAASLGVSNAVPVSVTPTAADPIGTSDTTSERFVDLSPAPIAPSPSTRTGIAGAIYTSSDRAVQPPRLIRPQLPSEPPPMATTGFLEILINERGTVEQVKLLSPTSHYHDRMMVSAAKAWRFRPALLDGRPVRYRALIPINIHKKE